MYTVTMTKNGVAKNNNGIYTISVRCTINDGVSDVFDEVVTAKYNPNATNLDDMKAGMLAALQKRWDKYVAEKAVFDAALFDSAVTDMQTIATSYVNA